MEPTLNATGIVGGYGTTIEFWNVVIALIVGLIGGAIGGAAIHSAWLHSKNRKEFEKEHGH